MWRRSRFPASAQTDVRSSRVDERTRAKVRSSFGFQTSPREREEPEAASHSIAVEFIVWNPPDRLIHTSCIGVKVRSLVSQPCYTYWERHPRPRCEIGVWNHVDARLYLTPKQANPRARPTAARALFSNEQLDRAPRGSGWRLGVPPAAASGRGGLSGSRPRPA
jgi:hypothetical protein